MPILLAGAATIIALPAGAQTCFGGLSSALPLQTAGATASAAGAQRAMVGTYNRLSDRVMIGAHLGYGGYAFTRSNTSVMGATVAISPSGSRAHQLQWCPYAQVNHEKMSHGYGLLRSSAGFALGRDLQVSQSLTLVPFARTALMYLHEGAAGASSFNHTMGELGLGVGIRLGSRVAVTPSVRAFTGSAPAPMREPAYSLGFQFGLGR